MPKYPVGTIVIANYSGHNKKIGVVLESGTEYNKYLQKTIWYHIKWHYASREEEAGGIGQFSEDQLENYFYVLKCEA